MVLEQAMKYALENKSLRQLKWGVPITIALCVGIVSTLAVVSGSASGTPPGAVDQTALANCISQHKGNCESVVPGLAQCMAEQRVDCNVAAYNERKANFGPLQPGTPTMTQSEAISAAQKMGGAPSTAPVAARQMTLSEYATLANELPDPAIAPSRLVWVVTVHVPMWIRPLPGRPGTLKQVYTIVFDATSKQGIEMCIGCATINS
jgi:hypothetical protein